MPIFRERGSEPSPGAADDPGAGERRSVLIEAGRVRLSGDLDVPVGSIGAVIFAHGSGSSRLSPRNAQVAGELNAARLATLLFDLLTPAEAEDRRNVFDIPLLADRLGAADAWVREQTAMTSIGLFGASTGAAAALVAASRQGTRIRAVVSRGGRPDLAGAALPTVTAPTLLIVGGDDREVLALNREAEARMRCERRIAIVPGATHLFEERGALERVSQLATDWFAVHLAGPGGRSAGIAPDE